MIINQYEGGKLYYSNYRKAVFVIQYVIFVPLKRVFQRRLF